MRTFLKPIRIIYLSLFFLTLTILYHSILPYHLCFKEQTTMFMFDPTYIRIYLLKPAALTEMLSDFITQFYIFRWSATAITLVLLILLWGGFVQLIKRMGGNESRYLIALLPVVLESVSILYLNYPISVTLSYILALWSAHLIDCIEKKQVRIGVRVLAIPAIYLLAGFHVITFILVSIILRWREIWNNLVLLLLGVVMVVVMGRFYNLTLLQTFLYPLSSNYVIPPLVVIFAVLPCTILLTLAMGYVRMKDWVVAIIVTAALPIAIKRTDDRDVEYVAKISTHAYRNEWNEVKSMALNNISNNRFGIFYRNLVFAREGTIADNLFKYPQMAADGLFLDLQPGVTYLEVFSYLDMLLEVGDVSQATDCALLCQTVMPKAYSSRGVRDLAEIALLVGDSAVANKYLSMLASTLFHKGWADDMLQHLKSNTLPRSLQASYARMAREDILYQQNNWVESLSAIASANPYNVMAVDYLLSGLLLNKNYQTFLQMYNRFYLDRLDKVIEVPVVYQQALLLQAHDEDSLKSIVDRYGISPQMVNNYFDFVDAQAAANGNLLSLRSYYGTYWYYMISAKFNKK